MDSALEHARLIAKVLLEKGADDILIVDIKDKTIIADYFVICSGLSAPQVKALSDHVEEALEKTGVFARRKEGYSHGRWIVLDYLDILVHIFHKEERQFYNLERLWSDGGNTIQFSDQNK
ncbi:MAG: ribosome silencing factor [Christensenellales bacterium]